MYHGPRIVIFGTSAGFVSPNAVYIATAASSADSDVERALAEAVQDKGLPAGIYVAKWPTDRGTTDEYIFTVRVETHHTHHVEVAP